MKWFDVLIYGEGGGVMFDFAEQARTAREACETVAERYAGYPQAARVQAWAQDRESGYAGMEIPKKVQTSK